MTPKACLGLAIVTAIAVALAIMTSWTSNEGGAISDRGRPFLPGLLNQANSVAEIRVKEPDRTTELKKSGETFLDVSGYPVNADAVSQLVGSLALLTVEEQKTADPSRYAELELDLPEASKGAGTLIEFKDKAGKEIARLVAGDRELSVGGTGGGQYIRSLNTDQSYLVRGFVQLPGSRQDWFDRTLFEAKPKTITKGTLTDGNKTIYGFTLKDNKHVLDNIPSGRTIDEVKLNRIVGLFERLRFADVRPETKGADVKGVVMSAETADGLELRIQGIKPVSEKDPWVRVSAKAQKDGATSALEALEKKVKGFEFKLIPSEAELFGWTVEDITTKSES